MAADGRIEIDTRIEKQSVEQELRQLQREIRNMTKEMELANLKGMMPLQKSLTATQKKMYELALSAKSFTGTNAEFIEQVKQLGAEYKKASDAMINANNLVMVSMIETAGQMMNMTSQAKRISEIYDQTGNALYKVNKAGLAVADRLDRIARNGNAAVLALRLLGPTASMKKLRDMVTTINTGVTRFQMVAMSAALTGAILYSSLHEAAKKANKEYAKSFENMLKSLRKAFEPMVQVFAEVMTHVYKFTTAIANMIIKFNEAHPVLAKALQAIVMLIPALTLLLSPLAIGIPLLAAYQAAWASIWMTIKPLVTGLAAMSGTVWVVAAAIVGLTMALTHLWKHHEGFRNAVINTWEAIKTKIQEVANAFVAFIAPALEKAKQAFENFKNAVIAAINGDFSRLGEIFAQIIPSIIAALVGGLPAVLITVARFLPAIAQTISSNTGVVTTAIQNVVNAIVNFFTASFPRIIQIGVGILTNLINGIVQALPTIVQAMTTVITAFVQGLTTALPTLIQAGMQIINALINGFITLWPLIVQSGLQLLIQLINGIMQALPQIIDVAIQVIQMLVNTLAANLPLIINAGLKILMAVVNGIIQNLPQLTNAAIRIINMVANALIQNLPKIIDAGVKILTALANGISKMMPKLVDTAVKLIVKLANVIIQNLPKIIDAGVKILTALINGIIKVLPQLVNAGIKLIVAIANAIIQNLPQIISAGKQILQSLIKGIISLVGQLGSSVKDKVVGKIKSVLSSFSLVDVGKNIIRGLINGISSMAGAVYRKAQEIANKVKNTIKGALGIHSPSRVMRDQVGKWIPLGVAEGIEKFSNAINLAALKMSELALPNIQQIAAAPSITTNNHAPITVHLKYNGVGDIQDAYNMVDILERELGYRLLNRLRMSGVRV
jgi:phage-related protein